MVSALVSGSSGPGSRPRPETLCSFLGKDTLISQCLSALRCTNWYRPANLMLEVAL